MRTFSRTLSLLFLLLTTQVFGFAVRVTINTTPSDAKIYVNDELVGTGNAVFINTIAQKIIIRVEKPGYVTKIVKYMYRAKKESEYLHYYRRDFTVTVNLEKDKAQRTGADDDVSDLTKLETLKQDGLITPVEATLLKDKLLDNSDANTKNNIIELIALRKLINISFITKDQFIPIKNKILSGQYNYGKPASEALNKLKQKSESGDYTKEDIVTLKNNLLQEYK